MKKNFTKLLATVLLFAFAFQSCKKGENDPFISLKSRDARLTGTWELASYSKERNSTTTTDVSSSETVKTETYSGSLVTQTVTSSSSSSSKVYTDSDTWSYSETLTIEKDGTYKLEVIEDDVSDTETGYWWWVDGKKNKIGVSLDGTVYILDRLAGDEMVVVENYELKTVDDGEVESITVTNEYTYSKVD